MLFPGFAALLRALLLFAVALAPLTACRKSDNPLDPPKPRPGFFGRSSAKGVRLEVALESDVVRASTRSLGVTVALVNDSSRQISLSSDGGRRIEVVLRDAADGRVLGRAADARALNPKETSAIVNPDERLSFSEKLAVSGLTAGRACVVEATVVGRDTLRATREITPR